MLRTTKYTKTSNKSLDRMSVWKLTIQQSDSMQNVTSIHVWHQQSSSDGYTIHLLAWVHTSLIWLHMQLHVCSVVFTGILA